MGLFAERTAQRHAIAGSPARWQMVRYIVEKRVLCATVGERGECGEMLAGSHQWCVDAGQTLLVVEVGWLMAPGKSLCRQLGRCVA